MSNEIQPTVLVLCDSNFQNLCENPEEYVTRLYGVLQKIYGESTNIATVSGKYGLTRVKSSMPVFEIEDRNKTLFSQNIENQINYFDNLLIISLTDRDPFLEGAADVAKTHSKNLLRYRYIRKS